jgi:hypothetical protein
MRILIASPTYDGTVRKEYMRSIMAATAWLDSRGIGWEWLIESSTILSVMRSVMASKALMDGGFTHILFVDTDMGFAVSAVRKLVEADKPVVGCAYPYRTVPLHDAVEGPHASIRSLISQAAPYAVTLPEGVSNLVVSNGLCEAGSIGTGLLLICTKALARMVTKRAVEDFRTTFPYTQWHHHDIYHGFFHHVTLDGALVGEDYSFCHRWRLECGGAIHAIVDEEIFHIGPLPVIGRYVDRLKAGKR